MKKILFLSITTFIIALGCVSCSSDDDDDLSQAWTADGWETNSKYAINTYNDLSYIEVPANGGTFTFHYTNTESLSIDSLYMDNNIEPYPYIIKSNPKYYREGNKICSHGKTAYEVTIINQDVKIEVQANNDFTRRGIINLNVGNKKLQLRFWQKPVGQSESIRTKLIGDWIQNGEKYRKENENGRTLWRLSFHADGTYFSSTNYAVRLPDGSLFGDEGHYGVWKDSCNVLIMEFGDGHSSWGYAEGSITEISDDHLKILDGFYVFDRVENTKEPVTPIYTLNIKRQEANLPYKPKRGEPYMLESKLYAKGNNFNFDKVSLLRSKLTENGYFKYDTIDISQYAKDNYEFSIPMQYTGQYTSYSLIYEGTFTSPYYKEFKFSNYADKMYISAQEK